MLTTISNVLGQVVSESHQLDAPITAIIASAPLDTVHLEGVVAASDYDLIVDDRFTDSGVADKLIIFEVTRLRLLLLLC